MDTDTRLDETFQDESIHEKWESAYRGNKALDALNDAILERFLSRIGCAGTVDVLDAGCGVGDHALRFAKFGHRVTGIDIAQPMLEIARQRATDRNLEAEFVQIGLEDLSELGAANFDIVHCRGVLMHIPNWKLALQQLSSRLRPGGHILVVECNHRSVEISLVRLIRMLRNSKRKIIHTPAGIEFHDDKPGYAPLTRVANVNNLISTLHGFGFQNLDRFTTQFFDVNRFPAGPLRNASILLNRMSFKLHCPSLLSCENGVIGQKSRV